MRSGLPQVTAAGLSATLHLPGKVDGRAHSTRMCPIQVGLDLVMCLHPRRNAEALRVGLKEPLSPAQGNPNHQRIRVIHAHDQAVMDVPRRPRLGSLGLDLRPRLRIPTNLFRGHLRSVGAHSPGVSDALRAGLTTAAALAGPAAIPGPGKAALRSHVGSSEVLEPGRDPMTKLSM